MKVKHTPIPKGSYHSFCRRLYNIEQNHQQSKLQKYYKNNIKGQNHRHKSVNLLKLNKLDQFNNFEEYMSSFNNQEQNTKYYKRESKTVAGNRQKSLINPPLTQPLKQIQLIKNYSQQSSVQKKNKSLIKQKKNQQGADQIVGAFLPYFKIKLDKINQPIDIKKQFKIDNRKFRIKSLLIQQNKFISQKGAASVI